MNKLFKNALKQYYVFQPLFKSNYFEQSVIPNRIHHYTSLCNSGCIVLLNRNRLNSENYFLMNSTCGRHLHLPVVKTLKDSIGNVFDKLLFVNNSKYKILGFNWYRTLDKVNFNEFISLLEMPDTFYSWYKVTELHVWMILVRLMKGGQKLRAARKTVVEVMWIDVEKRAKLIDPLNKKYKDNMKSIVERFKASLFIYDEGYFFGDMMLANALWFHFFERNCNDPRLLEVLVSYVRHQLDLLTMDLILEDDLEKQPPVWISLKSHYDQVIS